MEFLAMVEDHHRSYWSEQFEAKKCAAPKRVGEQILSPCRLYVVPPSSDREPVIELLHEKDLRVERACAVTALCCISTGEDGTTIQLIRKDGVPLYLAFDEKSTCHSFLTLVSTYYRLCDKWTFKISEEIKYPILDFLLKYSIHGPVDCQFVAMKFETSAKSSPKYKMPGAYLIRQCDLVANRYFIHFIDNFGGRNVLTIDHKDSNYYVREMNKNFPSIPSVLKSTDPPLIHCLRCSDFDKVEGLLLCSNKTEEKKKTVVNNRIIMFDELKLKQTKFRGRFTDTFVGQWTRGPDDEIVPVAVERIRPQFKEVSDEFLQMAHSALRCQDATIRTIYGITLPTSNETAALIKEYFELGPLDKFLQQNRTWIDCVDLLDAGTGLARALWFLESQNIIHGNIRYLFFFAL